MRQPVNPHRRRVLVAAGASGAALLAARAPRALAQAKPLPPYASWKHADALIVHSANTIETRRGAFGTSGVTDSDILFVRNNLPPPEDAVRDREAWTIEVEGVARPARLTLADLRRLGIGSVSMVLQCSGNGRGMFAHKASGTQWRTGACGNTFWSGVPVRALVAELGGVREGMRYMTSTGARRSRPGSRQRR